MTKLLLVIGFVLSVSTLGVAAANIGTPATPAQIAVDGYLVVIDYN